MTILPNNGGRTNDEGRKKMDRAVRLREQRRKLWEEQGERSLWQNLSMIGALGWLIVTPTLLGVLIGRWLDGEFKTHIFFSGSFIFLGVAAGCYLAWQKVKKQ